ncbi:MAG: hypothetical protein PHX68_01020 [Alphaproteobacteria bacterium]|nr:hypothetical protein [Alphaproteobacteria bacterium]
MTEIEKFVKLILPEFIVFIKEQENEEDVQKELDKSKNPSIHCVQKGIEND